MKPQNPKKSKSIETTVRCRRSISGAARKLAEAYVRLQLARLDFHERSVGSGDVKDRPRTQHVVQRREIHRRFFLLHAIDSGRPSVVPSRSRFPMVKVGLQDPGTARRLHRHRRQDAVGCSRDDASILTGNATQNKVHRTHQRNGLDVTEMSVVRERFSVRSVVLSIVPFLTRFPMENYNSHRPKYIRNLTMPLSI